MQYAIRLKVQKISLACFWALMLFGLVWGGLVWAKAGPQPSPYASYGSGDFFFPPYPSEQERMGFDKASGHDTTILNAGWYLDWGANANPAHPGGAEYARVIHLETNTPWCQPATLSSQVTPSLTGTALLQAAQDQPGALWIIGTEPDSLYNGNPIQAELYAEFYHYFVTAIKGADPTAKVSVGGIVQPSPLRLEYLDKILNHYQTTYGEPLPSDLWNIHLYILNEGPCGSWGGAVPPFSSQPTGWVIPFTAAALLDLTAMEANLQAFRQWMHDRGYGDQPLLITEFGVLPPPDYPGFEEPVAAQFLADMFELFLTATDPTTGYAADGRRLVQMWAWFSTDFGPYGGDLFETGTTAELTIIGQAFVAQTNAHDTPYVDLQVEPPAMTELVRTGISDTLGSITVEAYITNRGNLTASNAQARVTLTDYFSQMVIAEADYELGALGRRYDHSPVYVSQSWEAALPGAFTVTITADPDQLLADPRPGNNTLAQMVAWFPDLAVTNLAAEAIVLEEGSLGTSVVTTTITNTGNWTSTEVLLQVYVQRDSLPPTPLGEGVMLLALATGESFVVILPWPISAAGLYQITAVINPAGIPGLELNEANNQAALNVFVAQYRLYLPITRKG